MLTTVKLPKKLHAALESAARAHGMTTSELLRKALRSELNRLAGRRRPTPWQLGKELFGCLRSGGRDLSSLRARDLIAAGTRGKRARLGS